MRIADGNIFIAFGANLASPQATFAKAISALRQAGVEVCARSSLWSSPAWPASAREPDYINGVICVQSHHGPLSLLSLLQVIEYDCGRRAENRSGPRTLDLDLLDFRGRIFSNLSLTLPHPLMLERPFVLLPLREVAPNWHDPVYNLHIDVHIERLSGRQIKSTRPIGQFHSAS